MGSGRGASSRTTCAFVPLIPNALTPASLGLSPLGQDRFSVGITKGVPSRDILGFSARKCRFPGMISSRNAITTLMSPATPAAASRCPMFDFTAPSTHVVPSGRGWPTTVRRASNSMGSPSDVPVPCVSMYPISSGATRALASAFWGIACCESTFGVVRPCARPFWFTAEPRISPRMGSPSRCASGSSLSTTIPPPSPRTNPLAAASKVLHRPSGESACVVAVRRVVSGESMRLTPPASASVASPLRRLWQATCTATSDEEHSVSTVTLGPWRLSA